MVTSSLEGLSMRTGNITQGEAAGLPGLSLGFGLRYAMVSGYLAAISIIESSDYVFLLKKELSANAEDFTS